MCFTSSCELQKILFKEETNGSKPVDVIVHWGCNVVTIEGDKKKINVCNAIHVTICMVSVFKLCFFFHI